MNKLKDKLLTEIEKEDPCLAGELSGLSLEQMINVMRESQGSKETLDLIIKVLCEDL